MTSEWMRQLIDVVAVSIAEEVPGAGEWNIVKASPVWRDPSTTALFIYPQTRGPGDFRTTGSRDDVFSIVIEYSEPVVTDSPLVRDEDAERQLDGIADSLVAWVDAHQVWPGTSSWSGAWRFDFLFLDYGDNVNREAFVRYVRLTAAAHNMINYS